MKRKSWFWIIAITMAAGTAAWGATFGKVVVIGGHGSDLALDEARGVLYVANFTANRIEVMSLGDNSIQTSMNVASQPSSMALSADGRFLVVTHFGNFTSPGTPRNALTVIDLGNGNQKQTFALGSAPLGVAFGIDNRALVVTAAEFILFDPLLGTTRVVDTVANVTANTLPQPPANFPPQIVAASVAASSNGLRIVGLSDTIIFWYDVTRETVRSLGYTSSPALGPRVVSAGETGETFLAGWALFDDRSILSQFPSPSGKLNVGSHAIDSRRGVIYAQVPSDDAVAPVLEVVAADNLEVRERLQLPENLAGKSVLSSDGSKMYSISDSGVVVLPVGNLTQTRQIVASAEDLVFRGNFCDRRVSTQELALIDPSGGSTDFTISSDVPGIIITPSSGTTPATVRVRVDPNVFSNKKGTVSAKLEIRSSRAVNLPPPVRVLINGPEPDQRGTFVNVPGKLVDLIADPVNNRFFVLRQDRNQVYVFDGATSSLITTLRTGNTPTQMAITFDRRWLLVGHDNSQFVSVFDLETLQPSWPIRFPFGHYPRSIAAAGQAVLAAVRSAGGDHVIDRVDVGSRTATQLPALGVYENKVDVNTVLVASANGSSILAAQANGNVLLYNANVDSFTVSRKDFPALAGAYAASSFDQFVVGDHLLNASLVPMRKFDTGTGLSSGFAFVDNIGFRTTAADSASPGVMQRIDLNGEGMRATRMVEAPVLGTEGAAFTRSIAPLQNRTAIINLTTSGFTVLPWNYDASVASPKIDRVVNAADMQGPVAPGGLITLFGRDLSPVNLATRQMPLPTALGESCLTVNGVPVPMLFVSGSQVNAQLPVQTVGNVTMILRTPGGVSDNFNVQIQPTAPSVFRSGVAGPVNDIPTVFRASNGQLVTPSNPVHRGDVISIYLTGMGVTTPLVQEGLPAPEDPAAIPVTDVSVTLGGVALPLNSVMALPGQVGVYEVNVRVPDSVPLGFNMPLDIVQGGGATTLPVRVVN
jgi:uncharacterized protein (TIGR03437 family)